MKLLRSKRTTAAQEKGMTQMINATKILLYTTKDGDSKVDVLCGDQNIWLTQKKMSRIFGVHIPAAIV